MSSLWENKMNVALLYAIVNYMSMMEAHKKKGVFHNLAGSCTFCQEEKKEMLELFLSDGWRN